MTTLILIATILTIEGDLARIDKGYADGVRTGDTGRIYYTLVVGPEREARRIDVGQIEILEISVSSADFRVPQALRAQPGFSVEIEIQESRFRPTVETLHLRTVRISGGSYEIGVDLGEARFHNQYPRFRTDVETFQIDRQPISSADFLAVHPEQDPKTGAGRAFGTTEHGFVTEITFDTAAGYCRRLGMRLPTELEWEIAAQNPRFESSYQVHEWTSSWYLPYPGNNFPDEAYGKPLRVLKGGTATAEPEDIDYRLRRFFDPGAGHPNVGFRCVLEQRESSAEGQP